MIRENFPLTLPMREGLIAIRQTVTQRWSDNQGMLVVLHGPARTGKTTIEQALAETQVGKTVLDDVIFRLPDQLTSPGPHLRLGQDLGELDITHGFPTILNGRLALATLVGNADWIKRALETDPRLLCVEVDCDVFTRAVNRYEDDYRSLTGNEGYHVDFNAISGIERMHLKRGELSDTMIDSAPQPAHLRQSRLPSDIKLDTSFKQRISLEEAKHVLDTA